MIERTWRTDEPCPLCGAGLFILESSSGLFAECRLCGFGVALSSDDTSEGW